MRQTIAKADGLIKGRVSNPACDLPLREDGKLAVGAAVGAGKSCTHCIPSMRGCHHQCRCGRRSGAACMTVTPAGRAAGVLSVVRSEDSQYTAPYTGMIPIRSGEIAEDFAMYLADSEQTNSAVGLGVAIGTDLSVLAAGGFLVNVSHPPAHVGHPCMSAAGAVQACSTHDPAATKRWFLGQRVRTESRQA